MISLLCLGKPDFQDIEAFREDEFFWRALFLKNVPSAATLANGWTNWSTPATPFFFSSSLQF